ncbi:MAG: ATP-binding protein [Candidatus Methanofastidiosia archaeon]|jgi:hypothetical protein
MQNQTIVNETLKALSNENSIFVGRKTSVYKEHNTKAALDLGIVAEKMSGSAKLYEKRVFMDSISPHAVFICGMRGSGKSYTLGVIAEELALKNDAVGVIVIDPMGIFWSMKKANHIEREQELLAEWGLDPTGIKNVHVFIPGGHSAEAPAETWDSIFTIRPSELTADEWCLTFGFDRFDTMGLLLDRVIEKVKEGYTTQDGQHTKKVPDAYGIQDMIQCIETEEGIHSRKHGFKNSTRRALIARLKGAEEWGIFDKKGTQLSDLSRRGQVSVIDVSFLQDNVRALVVGILARNILNTRKKTSRKEAVGVTGLFQNIPVTWLMIDEAHILVPGSGRKTAATDALIEYVRQGRQPGCSIVLATQQPSAIDSRILSQVDLVLCHKLVYEDDIKAVIRRMPSEVPDQFQSRRFIKNLPIGMAIIGDKQEETSRCFLAKIRPRISQHEGREREPMLDIDPVKMWENVKQVVLERWGKETIEGLEKLISTINEEYNLEFSLSQILDELAEEGYLEELEESDTKPEKPTTEPEKPTTEPEKPTTKEDIASHNTITDSTTDAQPSKVDTHIAPPPSHSTAVSARVVEVPPEPLEEIVPESLKDIKLKKVRIVPSAVENRIESIAETHARRLLFKKDTILGIFKIYYPLYQIFFDYYPPKGNYQSLSCYVDGITGEVLLKNCKRTRGVRDLMGLTQDQRKVMIFLMKKKSAIQTEIMKGTHFKKQKVKRISSALVQKGLLQVKKHKEFENKKFEVLQPRIKYNIVEDPRKKIITYLSATKESVDEDTIIDPVLKKKEAKKAAEVWERSEVWDTKVLYYPYYIISYEPRYEIIDGLTGKKDDYVKSMLTFRL